MCAAISMIKGRQRRMRRPILVFLSRHQASIIIYFPRLGRGISLSLYGQARTVIALWKNSFKSQYNEGLSFCKDTLSINDSLFVCTDHVLGVINLMTPMGKLQTLFSTIGLLFGSILQRTCLRGNRACFGGVFNSLSSLGRMSVSCHHCFIVLGYVSCFCCMVYC